MALFCQFSEYTFCREFIPEYHLVVSLRWLHNDDVTCFLNTVSSCSILPSCIPSNSRSLNSIARNEKNEQVHQADLFKGQTFVFIFQHKFHIHLSIYPSIKSIWENQLARTLHRSSLVKTAQRPGRFFSTTLSRLWAIFYQTWLYCWSSKIIVTIYWMHFYLKCVGAKLFSPDQTNDRTSFLAGCFQR